MTCGAVKKLTSAYVEGEITADERRGIDGHIATCARCRATIDDMSRVLHAVQSLRPVRVSRGFTDAVMDRVAEAGESRAARREWTWPTLPAIHIPGIVWGPALAAAAVALVVFVPRAPRTTPHDVVPAPAVTASAPQTTPPHVSRSIDDATQVASAAGSSHTPARVPRRTSVPVSREERTAVANANPIVSTEAVGSGGVMLDGTRLDATPAEVYWILDEVSAENAGVLQRASTTAPTTTRPARKKSLTF